MATSALLRLSAGAWLVGCSTAGSAWMAEPLDGERAALSAEAETGVETAAPKPVPRDMRTTVLGDGTGPAANVAAGAATSSRQPAPTAMGQGQRQPRVLGTFKNTYYDFPSEADFSGESLGLMNPSCKTIASVPRTFYESVCVQGSGTLKGGGTVSFAKRDCACAAECPRTGQHICFDLLDKNDFPWGRGATGKAITPLVSVAVDSDVIPLGTPLYIPEYDGVARDASGSAVHDGCFLAEDRGLAVKGQHVDVFTGDREITQLWNRLVPTGRGVTVVLDSPRCQRAPARPPSAP